MISIIRFISAVHFSLLFQLLGHGAAVAADDPASPPLLRRRRYHDARVLDTRIIGGSEAVANRFPYAVSLRNEYGHFCGGSLIAKDVVLTAAHCQTGSFYVVVGQHDMDEYYDGEGINVKAILPHPGHDATTNDMDFMLVFLDGGAANNVTAVGLNSDASVPAAGQEVTVMGWGDVDADDAVVKISDVLENVNINVISNEQCAASEGVVGGQYASYANRITENMICAGAYHRDSCQGDSGGPLVVKGNSAGSDVQVGVVSWGVGCASDDFPGVYARVSRAYDWIQNEVCTYSTFASEAGFHCGSVSASNGIDSSPGDQAGSSVVSAAGNDDDWWSTGGGGGGSSSGSSNNDVLPETDDFFDFIYGLLGNGPI